MWNNIFNDNSVLIHTTDGHGIRLQTIGFCCFCFEARALRYYYWGIPIGSQKTRNRQDIQMDHLYSNYYCTYLIRREDLVISPYDRAFINISYEGLSNSSEWHSCCASLIPMTYQLICMTYLRSLSHKVDLLTHLHDIAISYGRLVYNLYGVITNVVWYTRVSETSAGCLRSIYPSLGMRQLFGDVTMGQWRHN